MATNREAMPPPMGVLASAMVFGGFSLLLWLAVAAIIPWLHDSFGIAPIFGWYLSATVVLLWPILAFGLTMTWRELPQRSFKRLKERLRLRALTREDTVWAIVGLLAIAFSSAAILALIRYLNPSLNPSPPEFLRLTPGRHVWVFVAWIPMFISNITAEELSWRGYVLPRQEAALGRAAWLLNGLLWCLFHWSFGWLIMLLLLPVVLLLPWIVQRRRNTSVGIVIHAAFNAAGFVVALSSPGNL